MLRVDASVPLAVVYLLTHDGVRVHPANDVPADFPDRDRLFESGEWINDGDAVVIKPTGAVAAGPLKREKVIL
jgi:hypothetical protein